ncbi:MAG: dTDP-4-dehydrorhamnose reductase [Phycisphaerales bacterium]
MSVPADQTASREVGPVAVVGALGMLGRAWRELLTARGIHHVGLDLPALDITSPDSIRTCIDKGTRTVVNCAAFTDVDGAETREGEARTLNATAVGHLAEHCKTIGATLIHYSTDYVFDGKATSPYPVDHPRDPVNAYGRTKAEGEQIIESSGCRHLLIRTSWLYAPWAHNFVLTMLRLTHERNELYVVNDQHGRPTSAQHLARSSLALLEKDLTGTFHVTDGGQCSWYDFTLEIKRLAGNECDVKPCDSSAYKRPAVRPAYSVLDISKTEAALGTLPDWKQNLADVIKQMES